MVLCTLALINYCHLGVAFLSHMGTMCVQELGGGVNTAATLERCAHPRTTE